MPWASRCRRRDRPGADRVTRDRSSNPLIVQEDGTVLLDLHSPRAPEARARLAAFAALVKGPEHVHTYRIDPLTLWNARASGLAPEEITRALDDLAKRPLDEAHARNLLEIAARYGRVTLLRDGSRLQVRADSADLAAAIARDAGVGPLLGGRVGDRSFTFHLGDRGALKQALVHAGFPAEDLCGFEDGTSLAVQLREGRHPRATFSLRPYQRDALGAFLQGGSARGGSGVIVLPCGAGKTIVGLAALAAVGQQTLVLCTSNTAALQWRREILERTTVRPKQIAHYRAERKEVGPITLTTYQMLTWRPSRDDGFPHLAVFDARRFGLIVYDEVHVVPAPVFRATARLQGRRRLGLTATLVREDGCESDVFSLIGPRRYDVPWRDLEDQGYIASALCTEVHVPLRDGREMTYALAPGRRRFRIAAENELKLDLACDLLDRHPDSRALLFGEFVSQVEGLARHGGAPAITGKTAKPERERLFEAFRRGELRRLVLSRVGNFAVDLPDADLLVQLSGTFGSRQEEAQRLGRVLRPKPDGRIARFYTLVSRHTCEEEFARKRQRFLIEQGYEYRIERASG